MNWTDSSSALGWLYHSTFNPVTQPVHNTIARHLANLLLNRDSTLYYQHNAGEKNQFLIHYPATLTFLTLT